MKFHAPAFNSTVVCTEHDDDDVMLYVLFYINGDVRKNSPKISSTMMSSELDDDVR